MTIYELKKYIEEKNNILTIEEYFYITNFIEHISSIKYNIADDFFEIITNNKDYFKVYIKKN